MKKRSAEKVTGKEAGAFIKVSLVSVRSCVGIFQFTHSLDVLIPLKTWRLHFFRSVKIHVWNSTVCPSLVHLVLEGFVDVGGACWSNANKNDKSFLLAFRVTAKLWNKMEYLSLSLTHLPNCLICLGHGGPTVAQWVALLPHSKKGLRSITSWGIRGPFCD